MTESPKHKIKKESGFSSLEGIFHGKIEHSYEDINAVQIKRNMMHIIKMYGATSICEHK